MKTAPLILTAREVRAILAGTKTQHRVPADFVVREKGYNLNFSGLDVGHYFTGKPETGFVLRSRGGGGCWNDRTMPLKSPLGLTGDHLDVYEEFWALHDLDSDGFNSIDCGPALDLGKKHHPGIQYCATPEYLDPPKLEHQQTLEQWKGDDVPGDWWLSPPADWNEDDLDREHRGIWTYLPWGPHSRLEAKDLPEWACRLKLAVVEVRVEKVNYITEEDAKAEGMCHFFEQYKGVDKAQGLRLPCGTLAADRPYRASYAVRWDDLHNEKHPWKDNPWVFAITFKRLEVTP